MSSKPEPQLATDLRLYEAAQEQYENFLDQELSGAVVETEDDLLNAVIKARVPFMDGTREPPVLVELNELFVDLMEAGLEPSLKAQNALGLLALALASYGIACDEAGFLNFILNEEAEATEAA